jgi:hypothetical protein
MDVARAKDKTALEELAIKTHSTTRTDSGGGILKSCRYAQRVTN